MMNVSFEDEFQQEISFDESGDPPAWFVYFHIFDTNFIFISIYL